MLKKIKFTALSLFAVLSLSAIIPPAFALSTAHAATAAESIKQGSDKVGGSDNKVTLEQGIKNVVNVLLFLIGAIAVIMIIIGGLRYVTSNGDASATKGAKDTILYAVIGIIVAILAYAIVNFVIDSFVGK